MFAIKRAVLEALLADKEWSSRLEKAQTDREVIQVLQEFCRKKGFKIATVDLPDNRQTGEPIIV